MSVLVSVRSEGGCAVIVELVRGCPSSSFRAILLSYVLSYILKDVEMGRLTEYNCVRELVQYQCV